MKQRSDEKSTEDKIKRERDQEWGKKWRWFCCGFVSDDDAVEWMCDGNTLTFNNLMIIRINWYLEKEEAWLARMGGGRGGRRADQREDRPTAIDAITTFTLDSQSQLLLSCTS